MSTVVLAVPEISCEHCERAILQALGAVAGVQQVEVDIPARKVTVSYDERSVGFEDLTQILAAEDYPVASVGEP